MHNSLPSSIELRTNLSSLRQSSVWSRSIKRVVVEKEEKKKGRRRGWIPNTDLLGTLQDYNQWIAWAAGRVTFKLYFSWPWSLVELRQSNSKILYCGPSKFLTSSIPNHRQQVLVDLTLSICILQVTDVTCLDSGEFAVIPQFNVNSEFIVIPQFIVNYRPLVAATFTLSFSDSSAWSFSRTLGPRVLSHGRTCSVSGKFAVNCSQFGVNLESLFAVNV